MHRLWDLQTYQERGDGEPLHGEFEQRGGATRLGDFSPRVVDVGEERAGGGDGEDRAVNAHGRREGVDVDSHLGEVCEPQRTASLETDVRSRAARRRTARTAPMWGAGRGGCPRARRDGRRRCVVGARPRRRGSRRGCAGVCRRVKCARAMAVFGSAPALACWRVKGKRARRTPTAPHAIVAHHGRPEKTCADSSAAAATPTGSNAPSASAGALVDAASLAAATRSRAALAESPRSATVPDPARASPDTPAPSSPEPTARGAARGRTRARRPNTTRRGRRSARRPS